MSPQTDTKAGVGFQAVVKDYKLTYYTPEYETKDTDILAQFVLVSSTGTNLPFNTQGLSEPNNEDQDVRLRDLIVLVMRTFQKKALDAKRKGKA